MNEIDAERFWSKVRILGEDDCWEWTGHRHVRGYGIFWLDGKNHRANRVALTTKEAAPYESAISLHSCDNPPCCNPKHLRWGSHQDNTDDRILRKGDNKGVNSPVATITNEIADSILRMRVSGLTCHEIAEKLSLEVGHVMGIYTGRTWSHRLGVDGNPTLAQLKSSKPTRKRVAPNRVITDEMIDQIYAMRMDGISIRQIACRLNLPIGTVSPVACGDSLNYRLGKFGNPTLEQLKSVRAINPTYKLDAEDIQEIVRLLREGYTGASIAKKFGVSPPHISLIKKRHLNQS